MESFALKVKGGNCSSGTIEAAPNFHIIESGGQFPVSCDHGFHKSMTQNEYTLPILQSALVLPQTSVFIIQ